MHLPPDAVKINTFRKGKEIKEEINIPDKVTVLWSPKEPPRQLKW